MAPRRGAFRGFPSHLANGVEERKLLALFRACFTLIFLARGKRSIVSFLFHFPSSLVIRIDVFASRRFWSSLPRSTPSMYHVSASQLPKLWGLLNCLLNRTPLLTIGFRTREFSSLFLCSLPVFILSLSNPDSFQLGTTRLSPSTSTPASTHFLHSANSPRGRQRLFFASSDGHFS